MPTIIRISMALSLVMFLSAACLTSRLTCAAGTGPQPAMNVARPADLSPLHPVALAREVRAAVRTTGATMVPHRWWLEAPADPLPDMHWKGPEDGLDHLFGGW